MTQPTAFDRIGGPERIEQMFETFYKKVQANPELAPMFASTDTTKLAKMQREFFAIALDGPIDYASRRLVAAHHGRGITRHHFSLFCQHLLETLLEFGLDKSEADRVLGRVAIYAGNVTGEVGVEG